jgi:hypothetical protein
MARMLRAQAEGMSSRDAKQAFGKMAIITNRRPRNNKTGLLRISSRKATRRVPLNRLHNSIECAEDWRSQRLVISDGRAWAAAARK